MRSYEKLAQRGDRRRYSWMRWRNVVASRMKQCGAGCISMLRLALKRWSALPRVLFRNEERRRSRSLAVVSFFVLSSGCCGTALPCPDLAVLIGPINSRANISFSRFSPNVTDVPGKLSRPRHRRIDDRSRVSRAAFHRIAVLRERLSTFGQSI